MPTIVDFRLCPSRTNATSVRIPFRSHNPPHVIGYALVLALILAGLAFGPPTTFAGQAEVDCVPVPEHTD